MKNATFRIVTKMGYWKYHVQKKFLFLFWHTVYKTDCMSWAEQYMKGINVIRYFDRDGKELK